MARQWHFIEDSCIALPKIKHDFFGIGIPMFEKQSVTFAYDELSIRMVISE